MLCQTHSERVNGRLREKYAKENIEVKGALRKDKREFTEGLVSKAERAAKEHKMSQVQYEYAG